ncbi:PAS domain S-box protein (plasmid) [Cupriavidus sp. P-10]|uniref:PAS domain-containing hybrid sensor histidine kinase/response regulator n=1 Tax=Cupriavidus sp. P-10 TaxID=2027911 RepID=UPI000E2FB23C|nr:PAS domain S-box protein [Cupriavidus sp. P-10]BDB29277.1 PAS domain S-box protein [Cupriavidus sp. P-10]
MPARAPPPVPALATRPDLYLRLVDTVSDYAIFALDPGGFVASWNRGAMRIKGYAADEILGRHFSLFYTPDAIASDWPSKELELAAEHGSLEDEGWRVRKDKSRFWANVVITALRDDDGALIGFAKVTRDLTQKRLDAEALRHSEETFRLLVQSVKGYAIYMLDPSGNVVSWNDGAERINHYTATQIIGENFSTLYTADDRAANKPQRFLEAATRMGTVHEEGWRLRKDGSLFWATVTLSSVYDARGDLKGFAQVTCDMTDRRKLEELEASAHRMNQFLATLAHELRNPLAPIRTATNVLERMPAHEALVQQNVAILSRQVSHMTRLVDDLLDIGRIAAGKMELRRELVAVDEIISLSIEAAEPFLHAKAQRLLLQKDTATTHILADLTRLAQVLQNILQNASKFSPPSSTVFLRVREQDRTLVIEVEDEGCGIGRTSLDNIFNLFVQEQQPGMTSTGGLGIGLSLSRYIVEMHGGAISAASSGASQGSTFTIRIPIAADLPNKPIRVQEVDCQHEYWKLLIVDDNQDAAESLRLLLEMLGHEVKVANTGECALRCVASFVPDFALLDLAMPDMNGFELIARLRKLPQLAKTRYVALTGFGQADMRTRTVQTGFHCHLVKPIDIDTLTNCLAENHPGANSR